MSTRNKNQQSSQNKLFLRRNSTQEKANNLSQLSKKLRNQYILTVFEETKEKEIYKCLVCTKNPTLEYKNIKRHILSSETHERCVNGQDKEKHNKLISILKDTMRKYKNETQEEEKSANEESLKHKRGYLKFVAACSYSKLSFQQIQKLGLILKELYLENEISFLGKYNFCLDEIAQMANCWGEYLKENLVENLKISRYSLCIDNATITGTSVSALQLRFLKEIKSFENNVEINNLEIQNRVIGLGYLGESSQGQALYSILKNKLLDLSHQIRDNFIGITHDHGSNIAGHRIGLVGQFKNEFKDKAFFNINDPCHSLDLSVYGTLEKLEDEVLDFVEKIHAHFVSPQRKAFLSRIQKEEELPNLCLKRYVETRWLSLGISLKRLLQIWPSLIKYMEKPLALSIKKQDQTKFLTLLKDKHFKLKAMFLSGIIDRINITNIQFQNQSLEIDQLPFLMNKIIKEIAELFIKISMIPEQISLLTELNWRDNEEFFRDDDDFLKTLARELDNEMFIEIIQMEDFEKKEELVNTFREFLQTLLKNLLFYLPIKDQLIQSLSFLALNENKDEIKSKIIYFNKTFNIIPQENEKLIVQELNHLLSKNITWVRRDSNGSSLKLWNLIEQTYKNQKESEYTFPCLSAIFRAAHAFAPSTANVEQCFSVLKLLKTALRNSIKENTLESLILIHQEFKDGKSITISPRLIEKYDKMKQELSLSKSRTRIDSRPSKAEIQESQNEEIIQQENIDVIQIEKSVLIEENEDLSGLLEKSCTMQTEDEEEESNKKVKGRLAKKSKYSAMLESLNETPESSKKLQKKLKFSAETE